jgi:hypothetical protein
MTMTDKERDHLLVLLERSQQDAEHQYQQCQRLADAVALLLVELIKLRGYDFNEVRQRAGLCGTIQATMGCYLFHAFVFPDPFALLLWEQVDDLLPALERLQSIKEF